MKTSMYFSQLLDPAHLRTHLTPNSSQKLIAFYRGMLDAESDLFEDDSLVVRIFPKYIDFESKFCVIFSMEIQNKNEDDLFLLLPQISAEKEIQIKSRSIFNGVSKVPPLETLEVELEVEVASENLINFCPLVVSFFACFEQELGIVFSEKHVEVNAYKKKIVLPVNILRFTNSLDSPDFSRVLNMKLSQEVLVNNQGLLLTDISIMFPNLGTFLVFVNLKM